MIYKHCTKSCFADVIGKHGLGVEEFTDALAQCEGALNRLRAAKENGGLPLLCLSDTCSDFAAFAPEADRLRQRFADVVVLGTGGSSLGGQALLALADWGFARAWRQPRIHFMDNIDPHTFERLLEVLDLASTGFIVISKSGRTAETLSQFLACFDVVGRRVGWPGAGTQFLLVSEPGESPLRRFADRWNLTTLNHDPNIGGRFSVLTLVGLLPTMIAGLDAKAVRVGAHAVLDQTLAAATPNDSPPAVGAAIAVALSRTHGITATVLMPYIDRLSLFALWFRQLWAESLGKDGLGTVPIQALGTTDQHSQLQLYLAGPPDKMYTVITARGVGLGPTVPAALADDAGVAYLRGRTLGDLIDAEQRATADTLVRRGRPVRRIELTRVDEEVLGALFMHFMLETIIAADLLGVNAFDQPAVEEGKVLTRTFLEAGQPSA